MNDLTKQLLKIFVDQIRDRSIKESDMLLEFKNLNSPSTKRWHDAFQTGDVNKLTEVMIPDIVDSVIFKIMNAIDNEDIELYIKNPDGEIVSLSDVGGSELAGYYLGDAIEEFSKERNYN